ncbi:hypothetical protein CXB51_015384 [Gossypium anomalum]|uniref:C2 domain-containing protein n=1 Tax=Gossypium anomalum TaxID=47600 RepID=A0A8J6CZ94_9ROSI|nr:hypothetical protein CXB51_015384 [Gossypium anomalum]
MESSAQVLEIHLISAQGLKRHTKNYAIVWVDPSTKLRTRIDRTGGENPTWNDKFLFKVSPNFLSGETSAVSVAIYAAGIIRDKLIGTVRILISTFLHTSPSSPMTSPAFAAFLIRSPSGEFFGTLNVGATVLNAFTGFQALNKASAIGYHELAGENLAGKHRPANKSKATVRDVPESIPSDSPAHQSETSDSLMDQSFTDVSLKQKVQKKKKKFWINLRQLHAICISPQI